MAFHVGMRAAEYERQGLPPEEAIRAARERFGNSALLQDQGYDIRGAGLGDGLRRDVRDAVRGLVRTPTFTLVVLAVLALSIGVSTAIYSIVDAVYLQPLPFAEPNRLVGVLGTGGTSQFLQRSKTPTTTAQTYLDWRRLQRSFQGIAMDWTTSFRYRTAGGVSASLRAEQVSSEFFDVLRAKPALGRTFTKDDEIEGRDHVVVVTDRFWRRELGADPAAVGRTIELNEQPWLVVGVMPPRFEYPVASERPSEILVPQTFRAVDYVRRQSQNYNSIVIGRLADGVTLEAANVEMQELTAVLDREYPDWEPGRRARVVELVDVIVGDTSRWMRLLLVMVAVVLLIACANVANLMVARATVRSRDTAVRTALGASRVRLTRAALVEGIVLSTTAALIGVGLAYLGIDVLRAWLPAGVPRAADIAVNGRVLGVAVAVACLTGIAFGSMSGVRIGREDLSRALKGSSRGAVGGRGGRVRQTLVLVEVALAVVLLSLGAVFATSFAKVNAVDLGFNQHNVLVLRNVGLRFDPYGALNGGWTWQPTTPPAQRAERARTYFNAIRAATAAVPGISAVAAVSGGVPIQGDASNVSVHPPGGGDFPGSGASVDRVQVTPGYLELLGVPLVKGRLLVAEDVPGSDVAVVNQAAADELWAGEEPLGQRFVMQKRERERVVVGSVRHFGPEMPVRPQVFVPFGGEDSMPTTASIVLRAAVPPDAVVEAIKAAVRSINPDQLFVQDSFSLDGLLAQRLAERRFNMALTAAFGVFGLIIAAIGIYGVLAYAVEQRGREIGLRMALGAQPFSVVSLVLRQSAMMVATGIAIGVSVAWVLGDSVRAFLFEVDPGDPRVIAGVVAVLFVTSGAAAVLPARRAVRVDPLTALRQD